jgi:hypothetical protein
MAAFSIAWRRFRTEMISVRTFETKYGGSS